MMCSGVQSHPDMVSGPILHSSHDLQKDTKFQVSGSLGRNGNKEQTNKIRILLLYYIEF